MPYVKNNVNSRKKSRRSRARKRRSLAVLIALALVVVVGMLVHRVFGERSIAPLRDAAHVTAEPKAMPPAAPWTPHELAQMRRELHSIFAPALGGSQRYSLAIIDAGGRAIYDDHADRAVTPASVQKLVVSDASLNVLGPRFRFHTILAAERGIGNDGVIDGNLWLVGSGDPSFRSEELRRGVAMLARAGLRHISGGVVVDPSAMHGPEINPHWSADDANEDYQTATSAISIDGDTAEFRVYGTSPGAPARVVVVPKSDDIHLSGEVTTSNTADSVIIAAMNDPNTFVLSGEIPAQIEEKYWLPVHEIARYAGDVLTEMLSEEHVTVSGMPATGTAPLDTVVLWDHASLPLVNLAKHMLFVSDNHYAEQFLRTLGGDAGALASDRDGIAAETQFLHSREIPTPGMRVVDGSGLAETNRIASITLARILSDAQLRDGGTELYPLLPEGGHDGTLKHYDFTTARGRVRAKTGHLSDADSLAGYVDTKHHGRIAFCFMINDSPGDPDAAYVSAVDRLATL